MYGRTNVYEGKLLLHRCAIHVLKERVIITRGELFIYRLGGGFFLKVNT